MKRTLTARPRILTYFLLGIALPSGLLGYLAFRGIRNDQALLEREQRQQLEIFIQAVGRGAEAHVAGLEDALDRLTSGGRATVSSELRAELSRFQKEDSVIEAVFLLGPDGRAEILAAGDLPRAGSGSGVGSTRPGDVPESEGEPVFHGEWDIARRLEFRDADLDGALAAYRRVLEGVDVAEARAETLGAIARVQRKAGRLAEAAATYRVLADEDGSTPGSHGSPWGPAASLELGRVLLELGDTLAGVRRLTALYRGALSGVWPLATEQRTFFMGSARDLLQETFGGSFAPEAEGWRDTLRSLMADETRLREREARLESFVSAVRALSVPGAAPTRMQLHEGRRGFHVLLRPPADEPGPHRWGLLLDADQFARQLLIPLLEQHAGGAGVTWSVRSREGVLIAASNADGRTWEGGRERVITHSSRSETLLSAPLGSGFPPWTIELHRPPESLAAALLTSRRGVYLYAFLLLAGILLFGLTLTVRSVTQELRLARMQADFVSTVSHELRSPLTAIRQLTEMLQAGRVPSEERRDRYYDVLLEQSERLSRLVDDVLDFARMDEGRRSVRPEAGRSSRMRSPKRRQRRRAGAWRTRDSASRRRSSRPCLPSMPMRARSARRSAT
jgi:hypothetical protein